MVRITETRRLVAAAIAVVMLALLLALVVVFAATREAGVRVDAHADATKLR